MVRGPFVIRAPRSVPLSRMLKSGPEVSVAASETFTSSFLKMLQIQMAKFVARRDILHVSFISIGSGFIFERNKKCINGTFSSLYNSIPNIR